MINLFQHYDFHSSDQIAKDANVEVDRTSELVEGGSEEKVADGSEDVGGQEKIEDGMEVDKPIEEEVDVALVLINCVN